MLTNITNSSSFETIGNMDVEFSPSWCVIITLSFCILVMLSVIGNLLVIRIILISRGMRTVTNYFLFNLSSADLLTVFQILPNVYYTITGDWIFGVPYCKFSQFFTAFNIAISVFTFMGITSDRYTAIMFPLRPRPSHRTVICLILIIWSASFVVGLPGLLVAEVTRLHNDNAVENSTAYGGNATPKTSVRTGPDIFYRKCILDWSSEWADAYDYTLFILMYALPLTILTATYIPITSRLWFHREIGEVTRAQVESVRSKRRAVKMMFAVMLIFAVCWLPYQLFFLVLRLLPESYNNPHLRVIFIVCYWLAMSNSFWNPIIYFTMNKRFRNGLFRTFKCMPLDRRSNRTPMDETRLSLQNDICGPHSSTARSNVHLGVYCSSNNGKQ